MVAASVVEVPRQLNSREENKSIQNGLNHFGDQNQIEIEVEHKLIGRDEVRPAWAHDCNAWQQLRAENNSRQDGAASKRDPLREDGYYGHIQPTGGRDKKLPQPQLEANHQPWKTDSRVEPIFGIQQLGTGNLKIGARGLARATGKIGWRNLADNIDRYQRCGCLETNNRNFAVGHSILTQNNVNLKFASLECDV